MTYTLERADELIRMLRDMPPLDASRRKLTKQGVVKHLADEITALQQRGYTLEQVVESLRGAAFDISTPTLKSYLQRAKRKPAKGSSRTSRRPAPMTSGGAPKAPPSTAPLSEPKAAAVERSGKQAFLVRDKDSY